MINRVTLIGNLGKDPEVKHLESGAVVARLTVATNENYRDKQGEWQTSTEWHTVTAWRGLAERAEKYMKKGGMVYVEGKLQTRKWQDQNGNDRYTTEVLAQTLRTLERRERTEGASMGSFPTAADAPASSTGAMNSGGQTSSPAKALPEDDLPF